jgi:hypothetical protein
MVVVFNAVSVILSLQDIEIESSLVIPIFFFEKKNISLAFDENTNLSLFITIWSPSSFGNCTGEVPYIIGCVVVGLKLEIVLPEVKCIDEPSLFISSAV